MKARRPNPFLHPVATQRVPASVAVADERVRRYGFLDETYFHPAAPPVTDKHILRVLNEQLAKVKQTCSVPPSASELRSIRKLQTLIADIRASGTQDVSGR